MLRWINRATRKYKIRNERIIDSMAQLKQWKKLESIDYDNLGMLCRKWKQKEFDQYENECRRKEREDGKKWLDAVKSYMKIVGVFEYVIGKYCQVEIQDNDGQSQIVGNEDENKKKQFLGNFDKRQTFSERFVF